MKHFLTVVILACLLPCALRAQTIAYIDVSNAWYKIYDQNGRNIKTISTTQGKLMGYSSSFYIIKQGSAFYTTYDPKGRKLYTFGVNTVGEIIAVSGDTFTSRLGSWILTWNKDGKKLATRSVNT